MLRYSFVNDPVKKTLATVVVLFFLLPVAAQSTYGITAGIGKASLYKFPYSPEDYDRYSGTSTFCAGITAEFPLSKLYGITLFNTAAYNKRGYKYFYQIPSGANNTVRDSSYIQNLRYIDLNLSLRKSFAMGEFSNFFVGTGPGINVFMSGNEKTAVSYFGSTRPATNATEKNLVVGSTAGTYQRAFVSWGFDAGFDIDNFSLWLHAGIPLNTYYQDKNNAVQHKIKTIGINAAYTLFTLVKREKEPKPLPDVPVKTIEKDTLSDGDGDGILDKDDQCPGHKGVAKYHGCPIPDSDGDGLNDDDDKCPLVSGPVSNNGCPVYTDTVKTATKDTSFFTVYFEPAKSILRSEAYHTLGEVIKLLKANSKLVVMFKGHTDFAGDEAANYKRSVERAKTCADYIQSFYIDKSRVQFVGYGNKFPAADLTDPLVQWRNRRVEIYVYEK